MFEKTIRKWAQINLSPIHSQTQKDISELMNSCIEHEKKLNEQNDRLNIHANTIEETQTEIKSINEKIDAIIECIRGDRKDINALINIYKAMKPQTKRKK